MKTTILPVDLPHGWKKQVAKRLGVHPGSLSRILREKTQPNYGKALKIAQELYGILDYN